MKGLWGGSFGCPNVPSRDSAIGVQSVIYGGSHQYRDDHARTRVRASSRLDLSEDWIAYLNSTDVPSCVDGVDPSLDEGGGDDNTAIA